IHFFIYIFNTQNPICLSVLCFDTFASSSSRSEMVKPNHLKMVTDSDAADLISSDLRELGNAARKLATHAVKLGASGFTASFLQWIASFAAIYLLILDRTNWKTNILTSLLIPYIFFSLPGESLENGLPLLLLCSVSSSRDDFQIVYLINWLELPGALILLIVVAPSLFASTIRNDAIGEAICLIISCYLLQEHIRASGGFRNSFTKANGISNTIGIILLFVFPVWALVLRVL
uniref:Cold-regulated 413 plasma membrane protein 2 n=1 Tax=Cucumis melo TaxID=3656 RepID=A0A9I9DPD3_CUCME